MQPKTLWEPLSRDDIPGLRHHTEGAEIAETTIAGQSSFASGFRRGVLPVREGLCARLHGQTHRSAPTKTGDGAVGAIHELPILAPVTSALSVVDIPMIIVGIPQLC